MIQTLQNQSQKLLVLTKSYWPIVILICLFGAILLSLHANIEKPGFIHTIIEIRSDILTTSSILSAIIITYLVSKVLQLRQERLMYIPEIKELTQKLHRFRKIISLLLHSDIWAKGLKRFVDIDYAGLSYFDVRAFIFVGLDTTEQADNFNKERAKFGDTAYLYLEMKSFIDEGHTFDRTLYTEFDVPVGYSTEQLERWIDFDCGGGLWNYFDYRYSTYQKDLRLDKVIGQTQERILKACIQIDKERYKDLPFDNKLLALLGTQFHDDILPKLHRLQVICGRGLPEIVNYLFSFLFVYIVFGVCIPISTKLYSLSIFFDLASISSIISVTLFFISTFYMILKKEVELV